MSTINGIQSLLNYYQPSVQNVNSPSLNEDKNTKGATSAASQSVEGDSFSSAMAQTLSLLITNGASGASGTSNSTDTSASPSSQQQALSSFAHDLFSALKRDQNVQSTANPTADYAAGINKLASELQSLAQQLSNSVSMPIGSTNAAKTETSSSISIVESPSPSVSVASSTPTASSIKSAAFIGIPAQQYQDQINHAQSSDPFGVVAYNKKYGLTAPRADNPANQAQLDKTTIGAYSGTTIMPTLAAFNAGVDPNEVYAKAGLAAPQGSYVNGIWIPVSNSPSSNDTMAAKNARTNALIAAGMKASDAAVQADQGFWQIASSGNASGVSE